VSVARVAGFDVTAIIETSPSIKDVDVLALSVLDGRVLLTFDKDFGDLAFRDGCPAGSGVILLRPGRDMRRDLTFWILSVLQTRDDWAGHFSVVTSLRIRRRELPSRIT
jgi:predicted nuclease of predicted toxin-antitoxin system